MRMTNGQGLVAPSDIASMVGVSRGAVSNWRKRADDFPSPVGGTPAKPLFSREAVTAWLVTRGYSIKQDSGEFRVWSALNELRGSLPPEAMAEVALSLACARKLSDEADGSATPWVRIRERAVSAGFRAVETVRVEMAPEDARWERLVTCSDAMLRSRDRVPYRVIEAFDAIESKNLAVVADYALNRIANAEIRSGAERGFVGSRISQLLGDLAASACDGKVLYDPACGLGVALTAALDSGSQPTRIVGHDIDDRALRMAEQRCYLRGVDIEVTRTDVLGGDADPDLRADVIVMEPPFGLRWDASENLIDERWRFGTPPRMSADLAWIQHAVAHLGENGRAYVITPMGTLVRGGQEKAIRAELVRQGCVEAVVGLPGKMLPHVSIPLALWVLNRPGEGRSRDEVLLIDGSGLTDPESEVSDWLRMTSLEAAGSPPCRSVPIRDVLAADVDLTPRRWTESVDRDPLEVAAAYIHGWKAMNTALTSLTEVHGNLERVRAVPRARVLAIGELVEIRTGRPRDRGEMTPERAARVVTASDVRDGTLPNLDDPDAVLAQDAELTRPNDVLVTTMHTVRACVDETGGHLPSTGVYRLRIANPEQVDSHYLALMLTGSWNDRFQSGSTIQRAPIRSLEIPLVPKEDQANLQMAILAVRRLADEARRLAGNADVVSAALLDAVRYGAPLDRGSLPS